MTSRWQDKVALGFAFLRGAMLVAFATFLLVAPEQAMPGASVEPARRLGVMFASRTILLGALLCVLAARRKREALAWVLFVDAALQVFDTGLSLAMRQYTMAIFPAILGVLEVLAGRALLRSART